MMNWIIGIILVVVLVIIFENIIKLVGKIIKAIRNRKTADVEKEEYKNNLRERLIGKDEK